MARDLPDRTRPTPGSESPGAARPPRTRAFKERSQPSRQSREGIGRADALEPPMPAGAPAGNPPLVHQLDRLHIFPPIATPQPEVVQRESVKASELDDVPAYVYHATGSDRRMGIQRSGFETKFVGSGTTAVGATQSGRELQEEHDLTMLHFGSQSWAEGYMKNGSVALRVPTLHPDFEKLRKSGNEWWYPDDIPAAHIEIKLRDGTWGAIDATDLRVNELGEGVIYMHDEDAEEVEDDDWDRERRLGLARTVSFLELAEWSHCTRMHVELDQRNRAQVLEGGPPFTVCSRYLRLERCG